MSEMPAATLAQLRLAAFRFRKMCQSEMNSPKKLRLASAAFALAQMAEQCECAKPMSQAHIEYYERVLTAVLDLHTYAVVGPLLNKERNRLSAKKDTGWNNEPPLFHRLVDEAAAAVDTDMGMLQLVDPATTTLHIVASRGFDSAALDFFVDGCSEESSACGASLKQRRRVSVRDIDESPLFIRKGSGEILRQTGVRAVQASPLIARAGYILGMISTHWRSVFVPNEDHQSRLDLVIHRAADVIEHLIVGNFSTRAPSP